MQPPSRLHGTAEPSARNEDSVRIGPLTRSGGAEGQLPVACLVVFAIGLYASAANATRTVSSTNARRATPTTATAEEVLVEPTPLLLQPPPPPPLRRPTPLQEPTLAPTANSFEGEGSLVVAVLLN